MGTTSSKVKEIMLNKEQDISMDIVEYYIHFSTNWKKKNIEAYLEVMDTMVS